MKSGVIYEARSFNLTALLGVKLIRSRLLDDSLISQMYFTDDTSQSGSVRSGYESCVTSAPSGSENLAQRLSKSRKEVKTTDQPVDSPMTCIRPMFRKYDDQSRSALEAKRRP
jgi:hypothetical protein